MIATEGDFTEYFSLALEDALTERLSHIVALRYGLADGTPRTLEQIGHELGVTRERIRQLLPKSLRKIRGKGRRQIQQGSTTAPCAQFLLYLEQVIRPGESGDIDRLFDFVRQELVYLPLNTHILPLVAQFVTYQQPIADRYASDLVQKIGEYGAAQRQEAKQQRKSTSFREFLLASILWPPNPRPTGTTADLRRMREVRADSLGHSGEFVSEKLGRAVQYESLLELAFLLRLEEASDVLVYQEQPFALEYEGADGLIHRYYPDVFFALIDGRGVIAEIKPKYQMALHENLIKWQALRQFCKKHGYGRIITDGYVAIQSYLQHNVPATFQAAVLEKLAYGPISWNEYRQVRERYSATWTDFVALVLNQRLVWTLHPFMLRK